MMAKSQVFKRGSIELAGRSAAISLPVGVLLGLLPGLPRGLGAPEPVLGSAAIALALALACVGVALAFVGFGWALLTALAAANVDRALGRLALAPLLWLPVAAPLVGAVFSTTGFVETALSALTASLLLPALVVVGAARVAPAFERLRTLALADRRALLVAVSGPPFLFALYWFGHFEDDYGPVHLAVAVFVVGGVALAALALDAGPRGGARWTIVLVLAATASWGALLAARPPLPTVLALRLVSPARYVLTTLAAVAPDRDGDGHDAAWGGDPLRDCDDDDPDTHPLAYDAPGDGVDSNCFAGDVPEDTRLWRFVCGARAVRCEPPGDRGEGAPPRNIVFLGLDAWRYAHGHPGGVDPDAMPFVASLVERALVADGYRSCAGNTPAATELAMSGHAYRLRAGEHASVQALLRAEHGYTTFRMNATLLKPERTGAWDGELSDDVRNVLRERYDDSLLEQEIVDVFQRAQRPFFLHTHLMELHLPRPFPPGCEGTSPRDAYVCTQRVLDARVRRLFEALERAHGSDGSVVVLYGDHGEGLGERGKVGHGFGLFEELVRTPLLFVDGGAARSVAGPAGCADLVPTALALAGVCAPEIRGPSLERARPQADRPQVFTMAWPGLDNAALSLKFGVMLDGDKLVYDAHSADVRSFDLRADPGELRRDSGRAHPRLSELDAWMSLWSASRAGRDVCR
jgi:hypothetical protein